ncbi:MAG: hypothetical protein AAGI91_10770 [Bacteroidota bacterium]
MRFAFLLLLLASSTAARAQTEYILDGRPSAGFGLALLTGDGQSGFGVGLEALATPRLGASLTYSSTTAEVTEDFGGPSEVEARAFSVGLRVYPGRQGLDGPVTVGLGIGIGRLMEAEALALNVGAVLARAFGPPEAGILFVPKLELGLVLALSEAAAAAAQTLSAGLGVGLQVSPGTFLTLQPSAAITLNNQETDLLLVGTVGLSIALQGDGTSGG